jgi:hypothetical protein
MLFHVTISHTPELCPADNPAPVARMADDNHINASGVTVVGSYVATSEHLMYFVLETDDYSKLVRYLRPMMKIGTPRVTPVQSFADALSALTA